MDRVVPPTTIFQIYSWFYCPLWTLWGFLMSLDSFDNILDPGDEFWSDQTMMSTSRVEKVI